MQAYAQGSSISLASLILRTGCISGKIPLGISDGAIIKINGSAKEIPPVDFVAQILHHRQFRFHKRIIGTIDMVAHQAASQMYM